ncbi:MAG: efflux RND transporter permease subunit [Comamonadaceae bacterium]|nr:efflux RND transporter permease subunit [Comamonadaceae bacterium]
MFGFFFNRPLLLGMILFIGTLLGVVGYLNMPRNLYPDMERPQVTVITQLPGAAALTVAQKVSRPIEQEIYALSGVRDVQGTNKNEVSIVRAEFDYTKGLDGALVDVSNALSRVRGRLPPEALASSVYPVGGFTRPVLVIALSPQDGQSLNLHQIRLIAENDIKNRLVAQPKIANVEVFGGFEPALRIEFDPLKLAAHGLSTSRLQEIVARLDRDAPLGVSQGGDASITLTLYGERSSAEALRRLPLAEGLSLGDVARVELSHAEQFSAFHGNGRPAIAVSVLRAPGGSVQEAIDEAESLLPSLKARYPGIRFEIADTQGEVIQISNANMLEALRDAIVFVSLVMLVFLANWRAVVTALISIPLVFLLTLAALWLLGQELNMIVMTGIILSLGMLVDDAVVVLENIERHLSELKEDAATAVRKGTEEVLFPVFLGTLATAAVLVPLLFVGEFAALMFSHMVRTVLIAVVVSYFLSVTLIPQISRYWYRNGVPPRSRWESAIERTYQRLIQSRAGIYVGLLHYAASGGGLRRLLLLSPAVLLLVVSVAVVMPVIGQDAMPPMDSGVVRMHVKFGGNVPVQAAEERMAEFERELMTDRRLKRFSASYGSEPGVLSLGSGQMPGEVTYNLSYVTRDEREAGSADIEAELRAKLQRVPGTVVAEAYDFGTTVLSTVKAPVNIRLFAEDWRQLPPAAVNAERALRTVPGFTTVAAGWDMLSQEAVLVLDEEKLRSHGLTPDQIAAQLPLKGRDGVVEQAARRGQYPGATLLGRALPLASAGAVTATDTACRWQQPGLGRGGAAGASAQRPAHHQRCAAIHPGFVRLPRPAPDQSSAGGQPTGPGRDAAFRRALPGLRRQRRGGRLQPAHDDRSGHGRPGPVRRARPCLRQRGAGTAVHRHPAAVGDRRHMGLDPVRQGDVHAGHHGGDPAVLHRHQELDPDGGVHPDPAPGRCGYAGGGRGGDQAALSAHPDDGRGDHRWPDSHRSGTCGGAGASVAAGGCRHRRSAGGHRPVPVLSAHVLRLGDAKAADMIRAAQPLQCPGQRRRPARAEREA